ncbi:hypothetical protein CVT24_005702 [Panaeolus cyanescens]|uniref:Uncharacterized protein n=1 Tax=Panaeolus cyanescens TaxID=181874 RepID=A0A409V999_9AGAR|nr:hypothetical protein CVT24_005702 [Panaeolus cyanescens]
MHTSNFLGTSETTFSLSGEKMGAGCSTSTTSSPTGAIPQIAMSVFQDASPILTISSSGSSEKGSASDTIHTTPAFSKASMRSSRRRHRFGSRLLNTPPRRHARLRGNENPARRAIPSSPLASRGSRPENLSLLDADVPPIARGNRQRRVLGNITNTFSVPEATPPPPPPKFAFNLRDQLAAINLGSNVRNSDSLDDQFLVYRSADEFLPSFVSTPLPSVGAEMLPTMSRTNSGLSDGSCPAFSDIFASASSSSSGGAVRSPSPLTPLFSLPDTFNMSEMANSISRVSGGLISTLAARYQREFPDDYDDNGGVALDERFEWEAEMRNVEMTCGRGMFGEEKKRACDEV